MTQRWLSLQSGERIIGTSFGVELKPKRAQKVRSWLIERPRTVLQSKFSRIRITRAAKGGQKAKSTCDSNYQAIFDCQNGFLRHAIETGLYHQTGPVIGCFLDGERVETPSNPSLVASIVTRAIAQEQILQRLQTAQEEFDCLEADGVAIVLAAPQLAHLDIEALLASRNAASKLSAKAQVAMSHCCRRPSLLSEATPNARELFREKAMSAIGDLDATDLVDLLHHWLIASVLDDLSIIVSAVELRHLVAARSQTVEQAGVVKMPGGAYAYTIAVVDTRPKSTLKLKQKSRGAGSSTCEPAASPLLPSPSVTSGKWLPANVSAKLAWLDTD